MNPIKELTQSVDGTRGQELHFEAIPDAIKWNVIVAAYMVAIEVGNGDVTASSENPKASAFLDELVSAVDQAKRNSSSIDLSKCPAWSAQVMEEQRERTDAAVRASFVRGQNKT